MTFLLIYLFTALGLSFLCSVLEAVLLSVTPAYTAWLTQEQPILGRRLRDMKVNVDRPLSAILSLNTFAHTVGAAGVGAEAQRLWGSEVLTLASAVMTLLVLVFSEIIPKTLGASHWRRLAPVSVRILRPLIVLLYPFVLLSEQITRVLERRNQVTPGVSRAEIEALAHLGWELGLFDESESRILRNLFRLADLRARDIMTPRTVVFAVPASTTVNEVIENPEASVFSRIPVYAKDLDEVLGYVLKDDVLLCAARSEGDTPVESLTRSHIVVPDTLAVPRVFETLVERREHIAIVVDEYGGVDGVVTMEDVLETLIGMEIVDEADEAVDLREIARAKWRERAKKLDSERPPAHARSADERAGSRR